MASIQRLFDVSIWKNNEARFVRLERPRTEGEVQQLGKIRPVIARPIDVVESASDAALRELAAMEADLESTKLPASGRLVLRKAIWAQRAKILGVLP